MDADAATRSVTDGGGAPESVTHAAGAWAGSIRKLLNDFTQLAGLEAQRAGKALAWIIGLAVAVIICVFAVWGLLSAAAAMWMVESGLRWSVALALVGVVNVVAAAVLALVIRRLAVRLSFPTVRRIIGASDEKPEGTGTKNSG